MIYKNVEMQVEFEPFTVKILGYLDITDLLSDEDKEQIIMLVQDDKFVPLRWSAYFRGYKNRNQIYCDMKQIVVERLIKEGRTREWIGGFLGLDHSSTTHLVNKRTPSADYENVKKHYIDWINRGIYPTTVTQQERRANQPLEGFKTVFKLTLSVLLIASCSGGSKVAKVPLKRKEIHLEAVKDTANLIPMLSTPERRAKQVEILNRIYEQAN